MLEPDRRARHREVPAPAHRIRTLARRGLRGGVLTAIVGGTLAFSLVPTAVPTEQSPAAVLEAGPTTEATIERHSRVTMAASRFETRAALPQSTVEIVLDGEAQELTTSAGTVAEALLEAGILVDADDDVSVPMGQPLSPGLQIVVVTVESEDEHVADEDPFETVEEEDGSMLRGEREVVTEGVDGLTATTVRVVRHGDGRVEREVIARAVLAERVDEVVRIGTAEPEPEPAPVRASTGSSSTGSSSTGSSSSSAASTAVPSYSPGDNRAIGADLAAARGWGGQQFQCLLELWERESNWRHTAQNPSSGAYGIPQSLPGSKMATAGADWRTNPATQITWGLDYIAGRYGTPCGALSHSHARGWY